MTVDQPVITNEDSPRRFNKTIVQCIGVVIAFITAVQMPGTEWGLPLGTAVSGIAAALAVYFTENTVNAPAGKAYASVITALGVALSGFIAGSDFRTVGATLAVALLGALSVYLVPNAQPATPLVVEPKVVEGYR